MATYAQTWGVASSFERVDENSVGPFAVDQQDESEPDLQIGQEGGGIGEGGLCSQGNNYGSPEDAEHIVVSGEVSGSRGVQRGEGGRASSLQRPSHSFVSLSRWSLGWGLSNASLLDACAGLYRLRGQNLRRPNLRGPW